MTNTGDKGKVKTQRPKGKDQGKIKRVKGKEQGRKQIKKVQTTKDKNASMMIECKD